MEQHSEQDRQQFDLPLLSLLPPASSLLIPPLLPPLLLTLS
jgi:hypothetical protein